MLSPLDKAMNLLAEPVIAGAMSVVTGRELCVVHEFIECFENIHLQMCSFNVIYHLLTLVWISLSLILSIFILNIYNRGPRRRKMPEIVRQVFLRSLRRLVCLGGDAYYPLDEQETVSMRGLDRASESDVIVRPQDNQAIPKAERDMDEIKKHIRSLAIRGTVLEARQEIFAEWQQVALVIDRIMCIFFCSHF